MRQRVRARLIAIQSGLLGLATLPDQLLASSERGQIMSSQRNSWRRVVAVLATLFILPLGATACADQEPAQNDEQNGGNTGEGNGGDNGDEDDGGGY